MGFIRLTRDNGDEIALNEAAIVSFEPVMSGTLTQIHTQGGVFRVMQTVGEISETLMHNDEPVEVVGLTDIGDALGRIEGLLRERAVPLAPNEAAAPTPAVKKTSKA